MFTDADWESFDVGLTSPLKTARLVPDENGWLRIAILMPKSAQFPKDPGTATCIVEFISGQAMYKVDNKTFFSRPGTKHRIPAGKAFEIAVTFTEVMWVLHYPPRLQSVK